MDIGLGGPGVGDGQGGLECCGSWGHKELDTTEQLNWTAIHQHELARGIHMSAPSWPPSYLPPHPIPLGCHRALALGSMCHTANSNWLSILYTVMLCFNATVSNHPSLSFPTCVQRLCFMSASPFLLYKEDYQYHLSRFHIFALLKNSCLSFSDLHHFA